MHLNRVFVITGATTGIGKATALKLARTRAELVLVGRNTRRASEITQRIRRNLPGVCPRFLPADISDQREVIELASVIQREFNHVDVLINNAGARFDHYAATIDGIERTFATNHLGHFLLTNLLLEHLRRAPSARVITVTSGAHFMANDDGRWCYSRDDYDRRQAYAKSKLANVLFAFELARRLQETKIVSCAVDPGVALTRFALNNGPIAWARHVVSHWVKGNLLLPKNAADSIVHLAAFAEPANLAGKLFRNGQMIEPSKAARSQALAQDLWDESTRLVGMGSDLISFGGGAHAPNVSEHPQPEVSFSAHG